MKKYIWVFICILFLCAGCTNTTTENFDVHDDDSLTLDLNETKACDHNWESATCTKAKTCSLCGESEGKPLNHSWEDATCTTPKTCTRCNATEGNITAHKYVDHKCSTCGNVDPDILKIRKILEDCDGYVYLTKSASNLLKLEMQSYAIKQEASTLFEIEQQILKIDDYMDKIHSLCEPYGDMLLYTLYDSCEAEMPTVKPPSFFDVQRYILDVESLASTYENLCSLYLN